MKKSLYTESQIIKVLHYVEGVRMIKDVCRECGYEPVLVDRFYV
jgi:hypothetical protein